MKKKFWRRFSSQLDLKLGHRPQLLYIFTSKRVWAAPLLVPKGFLLVSSFCIILMQKNKKNYTAFYLIYFSNFSSSVVYFDQLFLCFVVVHSNQLMGARHTLIYLITKLPNLIESLSFFLKM